MSRTNPKSSTTNPSEEFNDGNKLQASKISSFQKYSGASTRKWRREPILIIQQQ